MPTERILRGVAHDLGRHARSNYLGGLYPHLGDVCQEAGVRETSLELLAPQPYPSGLPLREPLQLAVVGLREWFIDLLTRLDYDVASIESVILDFQVSWGDQNPAVRATITTRRGKKHSVALDSYDGPLQWPPRR